MKRFAKQWLLPLIIISLMTGCFWKKEKPPQTSRHLEMNKSGIIMDANYDPRLDNLIPGYKMVTVAVTNNSTDVLRLNPLKDRWVVVDAYGRKQKAINSIRIKDPKTFGQLPAQVRELIDYPVGIAVGYSETVDLFFPLRMDLNSFRTVSYYSSDRKKTFDVLSDLGVPRTPATNLQNPMDPRWQKDHLGPPAPVHPVQ